MPPLDRDAALRRAEKALRQGRIDAAIVEYLHVIEAEPRDWTSAHALGDLYVRAGQIDKALAQYARTADHLAAEGQLADALALFQKSLKLRPDDEYASTRIREMSGRDTVGAADIDGDGDGDDDDRSPWLTAAELAFADGRIEEGRRAVAEALQFDERSKDAALAMAYRIASVSPDAGYEVVDVLVDRAVGENDYPAAAAALHEFVTRTPHHLIALMRLVDVTMEGGLESTMYDAQAQLADAYLDAGRGLEARVISEDLVAREPWNRANIERFRKALTLLGEPDPDAVIAGRLGGDSPFLTTDLADFNGQDDGDDGIEVFDGGAAPAQEESVSSSPLADIRLAQANRDLGLLDDAVRALDRAARVAPPATDIGRAVRYDLGGVLEAVGDHDRALAVFTGLESEQPGYRDVAVRIQRLLAPVPKD